MRRVIIVGTVPYNKQSPSRAFESYFHGWDRSCLYQVFSNPSAPTKGHCESLCQITDRMMLAKFFHKKTDSAVFYNYDELLEPNVLKKQPLQLRENRFVSFLQRFGVRHKGALSHLLRSIIWKKTSWCSEAFVKWIDSFNPECVFLAFSDDFFILDIALYLSDRFQIPIVSAIGDDYFFNYKKSISPIYHIYKQKYRKKVKEVFSHQGSAVYIGDKIRDKYNSAFDLKGETCYLTSDIHRRPFREINIDSPKICYFGNLLLGRNKSLLDIADALREINSHYCIHVYSNDKDKVAWGMFEKHSNIIFHGSVPYSVVQDETISSDVLLVVEGFQKKDVDITRYSLSTKVADSLSSGVSVFGYGSIECGAIEYLKECNCATVCTDKSSLVDSLHSLLDNPEVQKQNYFKAIEIVEKNHRLANSNLVFRNIVEREVFQNELTR